MTVLPLAIGIDAGGSKLAAGLFDLDRAAVHSVLPPRPTRPERGGDAVLTDCVAMATELADGAHASGGRVIAIGLGVPELVDAAGEVRSEQTLPWVGKPITAAFSAIAPTRVEADVRAAARAEAVLGAGRGLPLWLYISIGTGLSSAIVIDGQPLIGAHGGALVIGTGPVSVPCPRCGALEPVVIEEIASGAGIARQYMLRTGQVTGTARDVFAAADAGDADARAVIAQAATTLGSAIGWLASVVDPAAIVLGGGLGARGGDWRAHLTDAIHDHIWSPLTRAAPVLPAALGPEAGWIGAALAGADALTRER